MSWSGPNGASRSWPWESPPPVPPRSSCERLTRRDVAPGALLCARARALQEARREIRPRARERHGIATRHPPPRAGPTRCQRPRTSEVELCRVSAKERQLAEIGVVDRPAARTELRPGPPATGSVRGEQALCRLIQCAGTLGRECQRPSQHKDQSQVRDCSMMFQEAFS
jgi:hypothetical protein